MKQNLNIEVEGSELILKNKVGDYVIIPKKYRTEVQGMVKDNCHSCIDSLVETLPTMADYAEDGSFDGIWGDETKNALLDYQIKNKQNNYERKPTYKGKLIKKAQSGGDIVKLPSFTKPKEYPPLPKPPPPGGWGLFDNPLLKNFKLDDLQIKGLDNRVDRNKMNEFYHAIKSDPRLNKYQKAALLSHVGVESMFNVLQQQIGGPAFGPMQFEKDRQQEYKQYIQDKGSDSKSVVDYLIDTMVLKPDTKKHWRYFGDKYPRAMDAFNAFKNAQDLQTALESSYYGYVRPKSSQNPNTAQKELARRMAIAVQFLNYLN